MPIKRHILTLILSLAALISASGKQYTLVIDAGHGGADKGAPGLISNEKDINLKVAMLFGKHVEKNMPHVKVIYTRTTDVFVPLQKRADIANKNHADIFVSVHTNAMPGGKIAYGAETYTMGLRRSSEKFSAALRENEVITYESDYKEKYDGYDPKSPESVIMFELMHDSNMEESVALAGCIQKSLCLESGRQNKGVKQDAFLVLRETSMPACLVEIGYISTPEEERFLNTDAGIERVALGIYKGFEQYTNQSAGEVVTTSKPATEEPAKPSKDNKESKDVKGSKDVKDVKDVKGSKDNKDNKDSKDVKDIKDSKDVKDIKDSKEVKASKDANSSKEQSQPSASSATPIIYKVQVVTSVTELKSGDPKFKGHKDVSSYTDGGMYKYTIGATSDKKEILRLHSTLLKDFPDAFVIATRDGKRLR